MEEFSKTGRKLRPRKNAGASQAPRGERVEYKPGRFHSESRPHTEGRPYHAEGRPRREDGPQSGERRGYGEGRPGFGGRKPGFGGRPGRGGAKPGGFRKRQGSEGMDKMITRRSTIDRNIARMNGGEIPEMRDEMRLNKYIANSGVCSRREADTYILAGVVTVNGEVVTELGTKVNIRTDEVKFNGERLKGEEKVYLVMNKPRGYVTTASDPHAEKTVMELLRNCDYRVFPVGRLDKNTTGVLMFTNDGEIAERLTHPSYDKKKIYQVALDRPLTQEDHDRILEGLTLNDGPVKADELEYIDAEDHRKLGIEIHSGKNRIVRRIFESLGYDVKALDRVYFAGLTKKGIKKGEWRFLTEGEVNILKMGAYV